MGLAFNFLLTILIELPIIALFFKRKKRQHALLMALLINIISWSVSHVIFFSVDVNMLYVAIALAAGEAIAFHKLLDCKWIKAILMSLIVNSLSFFITHLIPGDLDIFPSKPQPVRTELIIESPFMRNPPKKC
ncbi:MAG: hypothetical protein JWP81_1733 [Ferruginibacter sp.]|nr:hypothetical protein [Ferruginibacter sp.]